MSAKVTLQVHNPDGTSRAFDLTGHDTFLLGKVEYCDGGSLADVARSHGGTLPWETLRPWALQALEGLAAAHQEGFVHRDLKPHNILIHQGRAKVSDFGLAKNFQKAGLSGMSLTGRYAGTPVLMPPLSLHFSVSVFQRFSFYPAIPLPLRPQTRPHRHHHQLRLP